MRRLTLGLLVSCCVAATAGAQIPIPFFKKKKQPPPAEAAAKAPAELPAPGAATPVGVEPGAPAITPSAPALPQGAGALTPEMQISVQRMVDSAIAYDARSANDTSRATLQSRMAMWQQIQWALPPGDSRQQLARDAYERVVKLGEESRAKAMAAGTADSVTRAWMSSKIAQCRQELQGGQHAAAEKTCREAQDRDPSNREVQGLLAEATQGKRVGDLWRKAAMYGAILVPLLAMLAVAVRAGLKKREEHLKKAEEVAARRSAVLQVVDGVGRGKLVTLDKEKTIFKIGAAEGSTDAEKNDLVISDSAAQVSRFHCTLVRRDGAYFVVDASTNGTVVNGEELKRGEHYPLEDGDEITIAQVSRLKFLHT